ncbi:MAG: DUF547 domain-containing protein [Bacteroidetes bacterium HGW-Bacteroidetes-2]|jgi:hypothetical protein|nr:MAG: DUF547 domain-containing protein [Bacteroidetes bacterium HGW-Bacteroidetes-2]
MKNRILVLVFLLVTAVSFSQDKTIQFFNDADVFFGKHITNGKVNYAAIKSNPNELYALLALAKEIRVEKSDVKTYQAFWINAYNLSTIKGIVANYPIKSPLDVAGFFDKIKYEIGGKSLTLNDIENTMLRAEFQEPRFHFVLVCAALSCPPIINKAYRPETLEKQLQEQTVKALNNPEFVRLEGKKVLFSQIMEWYNADFTKNGQSLLQFTNTYRKVKIADDCDEGYYTYDWRLNAK